MQPRTGRQAQDDLRLHGAALHARRGVEPWTDSDLRSDARPGFVSADLHAKPRWSAFLLPVDDGELHDVQAGTIHVELHPTLPRADVLLVRISLWDVQVF